MTKPLIIGLGAVLGVIFLIWLVRRARKQARKEELTIKWRLELARVEPQLRYVTRPDTFTSDEKIPTAYLPYLAALHLIEDGLDPSTLKAEQRRELLREKEDGIKSWFLGSGESDHRKRYERIVAKANAILDDKAGKHGEFELTAAETVLIKPMNELAKVSDADEFFKGIVLSALAARLAQGKGKLPDARTDPGDAFGKQEDFSELIRARAIGDLLAQENGLRVEDVYRALAMARGGKIAEAVKQVDDFVEKHFFFERLEAPVKPQARKDLTDGTCPYIWALIAREDLSLPQAFILGGVYGLEFRELEGGKPTREAARTKPSETSTNGREEESPDFTEAAERAERLFLNLKSLWSTVATCYESLFGEHFRNLEIIPQPTENNDLFAMTFEMRKWDKWWTVSARQMPDDTLLVHDGQKECVLFVVRGADDPVVTWEIPSSETVDLSRASLSTQLKGLEKITLVSLDGEEGGARSATIVRDRISGAILKVEAKGEKRPR